jgi:hypothetical protein
MCGRYATKGDKQKIAEAFCFLCGKGIAEGDFILDSNYTHNCPDGRAFEARISKEREPRGLSGQRMTK